MKNDHLKIMVSKTWGDLLGQYEFVLSRDLLVNGTQHLIYEGKHYKLRFSLGNEEREIEPGFTIGPLNAPDEDSHWHPLLQNALGESEWFCLADLEPEMTVEQIQEYVRNLGPDTMGYVSPEAWFLTQKKQFCELKSKIDLRFVG